MIVSTTSRFAVHGKRRVDHTSTNPMLSSLRSPDDSMESYMKRSRMQTLGTWAMELKVIAAASLLNTTIYIYAKCGETFKWLKPSPQETNPGLHQDERIYITNFNKHFEAVKKM